MSMARSSIGSWGSFRGSAPVQRLSYLGTRSKPRILGYRASWGRVSPQPSCPTWRSAMSSMGRRLDAWQSCLPVWASISPQPRLKRAWWRFRSGCSYCRHWWWHYRFSGILWWNFKTHCGYPICGCKCNQWYQNRFGCIKSSSRSNESYSWFCISFQCRG